jgi:hypothetical protein
MIYNTHIVSNSLLEKVITKNFIHWKRNELWLKCKFILIDQSLFLLKSMKKVESMNYH